MVKVRTRYILLAIIVITLWISYFTLIIFSSYASRELMLLILPLEIILFVSAPFSTGIFFITVFYKHERPVAPIVAREHHPRAVDLELLEVLKIVILVSVAVLVGVFIFGLAGSIVLGLFTIVLYYLWVEAGASAARERLALVVIRHQSDPVISLESFTKETGLEASTIESVLRMMLANEEVPGYFDSEGYHREPVT